MISYTIASSRLSNTGQLRRPLPAKYAAVAPATQARIVLVYGTPAGGRIPARPHNAIQARELALQHLMYALLAEQKSTASQLARMPSRQDVRSPGKARERLSDRELIYKIRAANHKKMAEALLSPRATRAESPRRPLTRSVSTPVFVRPAEPSPAQEATRPATPVPEREPEVQATPTVVESRPVPTPTPSNQPTAGEHVAQQLALARDHAEHARRCREEKGRSNDEWDRCKAEAQKIRDQAAPYAHAPQYADWFQQQEQEAQRLDAWSNHFMGLTMEWSEKAQTHAMNARQIEAEALEFERMESLRRAAEA